MVLRSGCKIIGLLLARFLASVVLLGLVHCSLEYYFRPEDELRFLTVARTALLPPPPATENLALVIGHGATRTLRIVLCAGAILVFLVSLVTLAHRFAGRLIGAGLEALFHSLMVKHHLSARTERWFRALHDFFLNSTGTLIESGLVLFSAVPLFLAAQVIGVRYQLSLGSKILVAAVLLALCDFVLSEFVSEFRKHFEREAESEHVVSAKARGLAPLAFLRARGRVSCAGLRAEVASQWHYCWGPSVYHLLALVRHKLPVLLGGTIIVEKLLDIDSGLGEIVYDAVRSPSLDQHWIIFWGAVVCLAAFAVYDLLWQLFRATLGTGFTIAED